MLTIETYLLALANNVLLVFQLCGKSGNVPILLHKDALCILLLPVSFSLCLVAVVSTCAASPTS